MKCVKSDSGKIERVKDDIAGSRVDSGKWAYCGKAEWKAVSRKPTIEVKTSEDPESV